MGACVCALTGAHACVDMHVRLLYYIIIYSGASCAFVYAGPTYMYANVCANICAGACAYATTRVWGSACVSLHVCVWARDCGCAHA